MTGLLEGKTALITGGATGIGRAAAQVFSREGAQVIIADILDREGEESAHQACQAGKESYFIHCDVSSSREVKDLFLRIQTLFPCLDCAFNNAGIEGKMGLAAEYREEEFDHIMAINLKGVWLCMQQEIHMMLAQGKGAIVNTGSVAGVVADRGFSIYGAAKSGVVQLSRTAAAEYAACGIRINAVCPGVIDTPMMRRALDHFDLRCYTPKASPLSIRIASRFTRLPRMQNIFKSFMQPMGRPGKPEEIAQAALWLCSDASSFVTGHALLADGGFTVV